MLITCTKDELATAGIEGAKKAAMDAVVDQIKTVTVEVDKASLDNGLTSISPFFNAIRHEMAKRLNLLPPGAAMAGSTRWSTTRAACRRHRPTSASGTSRARRSTSRASSRLT